MKFCWVSIDAKFVKKKKVSSRRGWPENHTGTSEGLAWKSRTRKGYCRWLPLTLLSVPRLSTLFIYKPISVNSSKHLTLYRTPEFRSKILCRVAFQIV
ncbi:hypothetical protein L2E82_15737 [Cichorium intybus]|uniref:Uncharacterized protein n=1 Tax=Cichorium intybus TaxID=13427 RepID=A0ACB9F473_CICIN|nr:hypothetical protein L2E82_15737 [Cichorium intybus]